MDTQDKKPEIMEELEKVGVTDLKTIVQTNWKGTLYRFILKIRLTINLPKEKKGAHMSRLVEAISETIEEESSVVYDSLEELERQILDKLAGRHPYSRGEIEMETELVVRKQTPVSGRQTMETYDVTLRVSKDNGSYSKKLTAEAFGSTVCPHAMEHSNGRPHMQRAKAELSVDTEYSNPVELEGMLSIIENGFSSETYTLLKTEDEKHLVNKMHSNPRFVEDVCRKILSEAKQKYKNSKIKVKVISYESIHPHNVIAEAKAET
ncbi:MAG: GTP cyclohydrolase IV [Candidatus Altiarchaeales archaeon]|nr:GTP cyclohydrolase IV [Candidatus Altiarchaeales archaeon]